MIELKTLYEQDVTAWALQNLELLKAGRFAELDIANLEEELADMGSSERNELENRLTILLAHLLKWQYQYKLLSERWQEFKGDSWRSTLIEQRNRIQKRLQRNPSLKSKLDHIIQEAYKDAVKLAAKETRLPTATFPKICPYPWKQIIDDDFYPQSIEI